MKFDPESIVVPHLLSGLGINARHAGDKWVARCPSPDHQDADPSWEIKDQPGTTKHALHHCFSCKFGGTATELVADVIGITWQGARAWIEERAMGAPLVALNVEVRVGALRRTGFTMPREVVGGPLATWVAPPRRYLVGRGITAAQVDRWGIGYAVEGRLNGRVVFPTHDAHGRVVNYTARTFADAPKRYLNPHRDELAEDGAVWGEWHWPQTGLRDLVVVTEGAINGLAVERAISLPVGALGGSNVHIGQVLRLGTFKRALLLTDPDPAGDRAAEVIWQAVARQVQVTRVRLPAKQDAASLPQEVLLQCLERAIT